jgi:hypothetical protein
MRWSPLSRQKSTIFKVDSPLLKIVLFLIIPPFLLAHAVSAPAAAGGSRGTHGMNVIMLRDLSCNGSFLLIFINFMWCPIIQCLMKPFHIVNGDYYNPPLHLKHYQNSLISGWTPIKFSAIQAAPDTDAG